MIRARLVMLLGFLRRALLPLLAVLLVALAWLPAANAPYQYDDYNTPVGDAASQSISNWWQLLPRTLRPLTKLTYAAESSVGADRASQRRGVNALIFWGCAVLLAALLQLAGLSAWLALLVACVWAMHPVHAETIVALAGRPVLLSLFLVLASALLLLREQHRPALVCAMLALLARESALPWLVACAAWVVHARGVSTKRVLATCGGAFAAGALLLWSSSGLRALVTSAFGATGAWNRLGLQWAALTQGSWMLLSDPLGFTPDIEFAPSGTARLGLILLTLAAYVGAAWLAFSKRQSRELRLFALLWLCLMIPTHSIAPKLDVLTARPFSASFAPLLGLLSCGLARLPPRLSRLASVERLRAGAAVALMGALAVLFPLTRYRAALYQSPIALWQDAADRTTRSVRPLINLGTLLAHDGRLREAESAFTRALERDPTRYDTRLRLNTVKRARLAQPPRTENTQQP
jgi:tetratricopeptide (TPR) repeat protein